MTFAELANQGILTQPVYEPGKPIDQVARELGLDPAGIVKLASNENPHGPSPKAMALRLPEPDWRWTQFTPSLELTTAILPSP